MAALHPRAKPAGPSLEDSFLRLAVNKHPAERGNENIDSKKVPAASKVNAASSSSSSSASAHQVSRPALSASHPSHHEQNKKTIQHQNEKDALLPVDSDIGLYDGGFERPEDDSERSVELRRGEAARVLDLDRGNAAGHPVSSWKLAAFELGRPLGRGKFGRVYMVRTLREPRFILALKCLHKAEIIESKVEKQVRREIEIQSNLRWVCGLRRYTTCHTEA